MGRESSSRCVRRRKKVKWFARQPVWWTAAEEETMKKAREMVSWCRGRLVLWGLVAWLPVGYGGGAVAWGGPVDLVRDGQAVARIVLPATTEYEQWVKAEPARLTELARRVNPAVTEKQMADLVRRQLKVAANTGDEERLAAQELQEILQKITGARLEIVTADGQTPPSGPVILLGRELAMAAGYGAELEALDRDGYLIRTAGDRLVLAGQRARGTLYAVYALLESLGCRWVMPGPFGEMYPTLATVRVELNRTDNPGHRERYFWCTYGHAPEFPRWTLRNRGNFVRAIGDPMVESGHGLSQAMRWAAKQPAYSTNRWMEVRERVKNPDGTFTEQKVWKEVPRVRDELLAMSRGAPNPVLPNISHPQAWQLYADYLVDYFRTHPHKQYASLSAEDGFMLDERGESQKFTSGDFDYTYGYLSSTDQLWYLFNRIIERVDEHFPDRRYGILVYANNQTPPRIEKVRRNMALVFAPLGINPMTHIRDERDRTNRDWRRWLETWMQLARAAGAETFYYDYEPIGFSWNLAMICPRWGIIGLNYPYLHSLGLTGHMSQGFDDWAACGLNNYLMLRLYWSPQADYRAIIADYCRARFGAAAATMESYYALLEEAPLRRPDLYGNEHWANHLVLNPAVRAEARAILQRAAAQADTDRARQQVRAMQDVQAMTDAMCDAIEEANQSGDFDRAVALMAQSFAIKDKLNEIYPNFVHAKSLNPDSPRAYESGGQYRVYREVADRIRQAKHRLVLPRVWRGRLDTDQGAYARGWYRPGADVTGLDELDTTVLPDLQYHTQRDPAGFFYRAEVDVPAEFAGHKTVLFFPGLIAKAFELWINGEPVVFDNGAARETVWRGPERFWLNYDTVEEFDITPLVRPGQRNTIAFRTFKSADVGGVFRRIYLLAD
jgi:hypothetical protein